MRASNVDFCLQPDDEEAEQKKEAMAEERHKRATAEIERSLVRAEDVLKVRWTLCYRPALLQPCCRCSLTAHPDLPPCVYTLRFHSR